MKKKLFKFLILFGGIFSLLDLITILQNKDMIKYSYSFLEYLSLVNMNVVYTGLVFTLLFILMGLIGRKMFLRKDFHKMLHEYQKYEWYRAHYSNWYTIVLPVFMIALFYFICWSLVLIESKIVFITPFCLVPVFVCLSVILIQREARENDYGDGSLF